MREFIRDQRPLMRAIATYGYECDQRGWNFEADFIFHDLKELLKRIRDSEADIKFLPVYLEGAVRRRIGQQAEELSARAKTIAPKVAKLVQGVKLVEAVREPSAVEILSQLYKGLKKGQAARRRENKPAKESQVELL
jgi:hypothetical protein